MGHRVGDPVSRAGDDVRRVVRVISDSGCVSVVCVIAPRGGWVPVAEEWIGSDFNFKPLVEHDANVIDWLRDRLDWHRAMAADFQFALSKRLGKEV